MVDVSKEVIMPDDKDWFIPKTERISICAAAAISREAFVFAAQLEGDKHSLDEYYTRFYRYERGRWVCSIIEDKIVGIAVGQNDQRTLFVLMQDGVLWQISSTTIEERIKSDDQYSFLTNLILRNDQLFVTGMDGQCYRKDPQGWRHFDSGMLQRIVDKDDAFGGVATIVDLIDTKDKMFYACGTVALFKPALFAKHNQEKWQYIPIDLDQIGVDHLSLNALLPDPDGRVWIATDAGFLLYGDKASEFKPATQIARVSPDRDGAAFQTIARFQGRIYAGSDEGVFELKADGSWNVAKGTLDLPMNQNQEQDTIVRAVFLRVIDDVIWAFGYDTISFFDGLTWSRIRVPPIHKTKR